MKFPTYALAILPCFVSSASAAAVNRSSKPWKRQTGKHSVNYAGIQQYPPPDGSTYNYITTTINIPDTRYVSAHGTPPTPEKSSAWIGFGPTTPGSSTSGIMQTGCAFSNDGQGDQTNRCWVEFYPGPVSFFSGFSPSAGDYVTIELWRNSPTQGLAKLTNSGTGAAVSTTFSAPSGHSSNGQLAEWIVEDQGSPNGRAPLVDFGTSVFSGPRVTTEAGNSYVAFSGSYAIVDMVASGVPQASTSGGQSGSIQVTYVGPSA